MNMQNQAYTNYGEEKLQKESPQLFMVTERLSKQLSHQSSLIYEIEEKLHQIYNLRTPDKQPTLGTEAPMNTDFFSTISCQLANVDVNNNKLENIIGHLKRIV